MTIAGFHGEISLTDIALPLADTSDMIQLHQVFREAFGAAVPLVGSVAAGDVERAEIVGTFYDNVLEFLHAHHDTEDELVWPKLIARSPDQAATVQRVAGQHAGVLAALQLAQSRLVGWRADPQIDSGAQLAVALATLGVELCAHLDEEEQVILPIAAMHMTGPEWGELPSYGMQRFGGDKIWLVLGLIQEQLSAAEIAEMESHMPPPVLEFWTGVGKPQFQEFVTELRA
ncbi:MAG: hypothetical protein QOF18_2174 [Frankiaceae bacterium]|nr:hypothetical protein [Frankiaceae bacterium]